MYLSPFHHCLYSPTILKKILCHFLLDFVAALLNPLTDNKILDQTKLKAFADNKLNVTNMIIFVFDRVENILGKGEIACTSNFSFSHNVFKRLLFPDASKGVIVWKWVK